MKQCNSEEMPHYYESVEKTSKTHVCRYILSDGDASGMQPCSFHLSNSVNSESHEI